MTASGPDSAPAPFILALSCDSCPGLLGAVGTALETAGATIQDAKHYSDPDTGRFFFRADFTASTDAPGREALAARLEAAVGKRHARWGLYRAAERPRLVVMVSRQGHCLDDLLHRQRAGLLPAEIVAVISNHDKFRDLVAWHGLPYYHLPVTPETKPEQEARLRALITEHAADYVILARYMQILSEEFCDAFPDRIVNIHHSFLPAFKGADPHSRARELGVKMIGATAHFVIPALDEGPIIEQDVIRVSHEAEADELKRLSRDIERTVLARAVRYIAERRVFCNGQRTVVF